MEDEEVYNPIFVSFEWTQGVTITPGTMQAGDTVRAEFRVREKDEQAVAVISSGSGITVTGDLIVLTLSEQQTRLMKPDFIKTNLVIVRGAHELEIASVITIPVAYLPSRSLP